MRDNISRSDDRGVSESIGFMLIFTIVIAGIALVTLYGYPLLLKQQVSSEEKIMEKNMIVLQNDMKSLAYKTVPFKETSLKIGGGSLTVYNSSTPASSNISIYNQATGDIYVDKFTPGELRYESVSSQTDISLQNGAVVMRPRIQPGSTMLAQPRWFYDMNPITGRTMVINLINITSDNNMAKEGIGTVRMTLGETNYNYTSGLSGTTTFKLAYTPGPGQDYSSAWDNYFTQTLKLPLPSISGSKRTYTLPPIDTLVIKRYEVNIEAI